MIADMDLNDLVLRGLANGDWPLPVELPFTYAQARDAGITRNALRVLIDRGRLRRPIQGVYVAAHLPDTLPLRAACLGLVAPPDCVVVDRHAGWVAGAEMALAPGEHLQTFPISLFRPSGRGRLRNGFSRSGERWLRDSDVLEVGGLRFTRPVRTAWDLGRVRWTDEAISGMDAVARLPGFDLDEFRNGIEQFRGHRWISTLRAVAPLVDGRCESPPESVLKLRCHEAGLPMTPQLEVRVGYRLMRLDLGNADLRGGAEYDGVEWHDSPDQRAHDHARRDELAEDGWLIEVFTKDDLWGSHGGADVRLQAFRRLLFARRHAQLAG